MIHIHCWFLFVCTQEKHDRRMILWWYSHPYLSWLMIKYLAQPYSTLPFSPNDVAPSWQGLPLGFSPIIIKHFSRKKIWRQLNFTCIHTQTVHSGMQWRRIRLEIPVRTALSTRHSFWKKLYKILKEGSTKSYLFLKYSICWQ
jgi:hypothetical protein